MAETRKEIHKSAESFRKLEKTEWQAVRDWHVYPVLDSNTGTIKWKIDFFDSTGRYRWVSFEGRQTQVTGGTRKKLHGNLETNLRP